MSGPKANNAGPETNVSGPELDNNTSACALSFLLLAFFQIGQSHFGNCDGIGLKTSSNELALHAAIGQNKLVTACSGAGSRRAFFARRNPSPSCRSTHS